MASDHITTVNDPLRQYFPIWMDFHELHLSIIRQQLPYWAEISKEQEKLCNKGRKLCVVFDLDEVLISPLHHNVFGNAFDVADHFKLLDDKSLCPSYPGSKEVLQKCKDIGLFIFFVTARSELSRDQTTRNLVKLNLIPDHLFMRGVDIIDVPASVWKTSIRKTINEQYRVIASIGDQISDLGDYADINYLIPHHFYRTK